MVGQLMMTHEWDDWRNGVFGWIQSVFVKSEFRGKGVYRAPYSPVKVMAGEGEGVCGFRLFVDKENDRAQATYRRLEMHEARCRIFEKP